MAGAQKAEDLERLAKLVRYDREIVKGESASPSGASTSSERALRSMAKSPVP